MSQPLTGIVRRRLPELPVYEGWLLIQLADMVHTETRQWRETWHGLTLRLRRKHSWKIRRAAYRLRDRGWLELRSDGRAIIITLTPEKSLPGSPFLGRQTATHGSYQVATHGSNQSATAGGQQVATAGSPIDNPPYDPPRRNAPKTPGMELESVSNKKGGEVAGNGIPPLPERKAKSHKPAPSDSRNGTPRPLTQSEKISAQDELKRVEDRIRWIDDNYEAHMGRDEWSKEDRDLDRILKARRKELMAALGWKA